MEAFLRTPGVATNLSRKQLSPFLVSLMSQTGETSVYGWGPNLDNCVILHVEDDDSAAFLFLLAVEQAGISTSIYRVKDGEQALLFLRKQPPYQNARTPKLAIVDLNLPKVNGWELLAMRQTDPALKPIPFIVMSTAPASRAAAKALKNGAEHYIEKPASFDELVQQVQTYCKSLVK